MRLLLLMLTNVKVFGRAKINNETVVLKDDNIWSVSQIMYRGCFNTFST